MTPLITTHKPKVPYQRVVPHNRSVLMVFQSEERIQLAADESVPIGILVESKASSDHCAKHPWQIQSHSKVSELPVERSRHTTWTFWWDSTEVVVVASHGAPVHRLTPAAAGTVHMGSSGPRPGGGGKDTQRVTLTHHHHGFGSALGAMCLRSRPLRALSTQKCGETRQDTNSSVHPNTHSH